MQRNIKLTIEYDGTDFYGWQIQAKHQRTVAGEIEKALKKIFHKNIRLIGSGRTDSGVHALGQVANFKVVSPLKLQQIKRALNANLPEDVAVWRVEEVGADFHAQYSVHSKTYRYTVLNRDVRSPLQRHYCLVYPYPLNVRRMKEEAKSLVGRKDFRAFQAANPSRDEKATTVRTVRRVDIRKKGDFLSIEIEADGFLYKMVRNIVGTLLEAGQGRLPKGSIKAILAQKDRALAGDTARPQGLTLVEVKY
ncbi:MAG: tRNA pseudouridine(38-40) synthase TruA [Candidatus Omnitrophica bacterium]|nr:tRNA pseudouridine(38-40) synthase TruA [Candidatus Omnitrophota bacterium]